jgi:YVTN family beta-propeller protein
LPTHVLKTIAVSCDASSASVDPAKNLVYAAGFGCVSVINGATNHVVKTLHFDGGVGAVGFDPVHGYLFFSVSGESNQLIVVNTVTGRIVAHLDLRGYPTSGIYVRGNVYVTLGVSGGVGGKSDHVDVFNTTTLHLVARVAVGSYPCTATYDRRNGNLYIENCLSNTVSVLRASDHRVISTFPGGQNLGCIIFDPRNGNLYLANYGFGGGSTVTVINAASHAIVTSIGVGASPRGCAFDPQSNRLYIGNAGSDDVSVIDPFTESVVRTVPVGLGPDGEVYDAINQETYVCDASTNTVTVLAP